MVPVWKDYDYSFTITQPTEYSVEYYGGDSVFNGIAVPKPGTTSASVRLSEFAKNMVNSDCEIERLLGERDNECAALSDYCRYIALSKVNEDGGKSLLFADWFANNYNYNDNTEFNYDNIYVLNSGLGGLTDKGDNLITVFNGYEDTTLSIEILIEPSDEDIESGAEEEWLFGNVHIPPMTAMVYNIKNLPLGAKVVVIYDGDGTEINLGVVKKECNRYKLHYINSNGGYETLSIDGKRDKRTDNLNFEYYKTRGNNQNINTPQMHKFKTDITPKWEVQTGWLNDEQSEKMYNIYTSHKMWLEDMNEGKIYPVYITNSSFDYKTFTNVGKKKYNYSFSLTSANTLIKL